MYQISLSRTKLVKRLSWTAGFLLLMHGILVTYNYTVDEVTWYFLQLFDVNEEENLPTWFSGFNLLVATAFLGILVSEKRRLGDVMKGRWTVLFVGFCFLSIDEIAGLHESVNSIIEPSWAWGGGVIALVLGVYFLPFLKTLPKATFVNFVIAGAVFVGGAVGMELIGEPIDSDSLAYNISTMIEEGMEMFGVILFTRGLLSYMMDGKDKATIEWSI